MQVPPQNEKISLLIDDELNSEQALALLETLQGNAELKGKLQRYQLISQVLKNESCCLPDSQFSDKIHQRIRQEPIHFLPARNKSKRWHKIGLAMAASLALAVVWLVNKIDKSSYTYVQPQMAYALPRQPASASSANTRLVEYLQAHDNAAYTNNAPAQPFARVVGYQQE